MTRMMSRGLSPTLKAISFLVSLQLIVGPLCFYFLGHQISGKKTDGFLDAFYFNMVLMTSTGYGDFTPNTTLAVLLASLFAIFGKILLGLLMNAGLERYEIENDEGIFTLGFWYVAFMVAGTLVLFLVENLGFVHAFYCIITTVTGVGSSKCFSTKSGRVFAIFWMLYGTICLVGLLLTFGQLYAKRRQKALKERVLEGETTSEDFLKADLDEDGVLSISEYTLYKLYEMGKFDLNDTVPFVKDFQERNVNNKNGLTLDEINNPRGISQRIMLAQSTLV
ncbi:hypothetical protein OSB04_004050 [Centaurea solstitialis]|uniref:Potassium channel domain-containing protein n=1 Tax=Centaurea solstitialis TaxID=347529 RepID=A0AA38WVG5_9ASTR|nr:hypothetical protein OSB04_004050 [Centaurea solstitialis]